jgi:hypothetical protein
MWTYSTDAVANQSFNAPSVEKVTGITVDGKQYADKYLFNGESPVIEDGRLAIAGIVVDGNMMSPQNVSLNGESIIENGAIVYANGTPKVSPDNGVIAEAGATLRVDGADVTVANSALTCSQLSMVEPGTTLTLAHIATIDKKTGKYALEQTSDVPTKATSVISVDTTPVLNAASKQYQDAGDWVGVLFAIQAIAAVIWAVVLPRFRSRKIGYSVSLLIGAIGFISVYFFTSKYMLGVSYALVGCAWAAMLAMPFTILTNALNGDHIGTYLGLFNCTICVPQIIAALCGGLILSMFAPAANGAPNTVWMLVTAGVLLAIGSVAVWNVRETYGSQQK